jgi:hypothetical protein
MFKATRFLAVTLACSLLAVSVTAAQETVAFDLRSAVDGGLACPGTAVVWEIWVEITTTDNEGLALACVDLVQDAANPEKFDIPYADDVPVGMENFSRPEGVSNPGEGGNSTGYVGVQRGVAGEMNLIQLGGGQNTFGVAGQSIGTDPNVDANIAKGVATLLVAGSFTAPTTTGQYTFTLQDAVANTITQVNTPPAYSPVDGGAVSYVNQSITFTVPIIGDLDGDGDVDLSDLAGLLGSYGVTSGATCAEGDWDGDGDVDLADLASLLGNYGT